MDATTIFISLITLTVILGGLWWLNKQRQNRPVKAAQELGAAISKALTNLEIPITTKKFEKQIPDLGICVLMEIAKGMILIQIADHQNRGDASWLTKSSVMIRMEGDPQAHSPFAIKAVNTSTLEIRDPYRTEGMLKITKFSPVVEKPDIA